MKLVIHPKYTPSRPPLFTTIVIGLLLDRLNAPGWIWGCVGMLFLFLWVGMIHGMVTEKYAKPALALEEESGRPARNWNQ